MSQAIERPVPISTGSSAFAEFEFGPFRITTADFAGGCSIEPHHHDRPNVGVMLEGSFELAFANREFACTPGTLFIEPAGETHCNCMGKHGARVLALQPDPRSTHVETILAAFAEPRMQAHPHSTHLARRIARECRYHDAFTGLMIQGLACELIAEAARAASRRATPAAPSLERIEQMLLDQDVAHTTVTALASEAGVHVAHLARSFRAAYGRSLGGFLLERRLEWAARELAETERSISEIALDAGFADQSHFTRRFRTYTGATPRRFRLARHTDAA